MSLRVFSTVGLVLSLAASTRAPVRPRRRLLQPNDLAARAHTANDLKSALDAFPTSRSRSSARAGRRSPACWTWKTERRTSAARWPTSPISRTPASWRKCPEPFDQLRGMAVTGLNTMHLLVGRNARVETLRDLKGLRISHRRARQLDRAHHAAHASGLRYRARTDSRGAHPERRDREPSEQRRHRRRLLRVQPAERNRHRRDAARREAHSRSTAL